VLVGSDHSTDVPLRNALLVYGWYPDTEPPAPERWTSSPLPAGRTKPEVVFVKNAPVGFVYA
jgi:hypothetical protein